MPSLYELQPLACRQPVSPQKVSTRGRHAGIIQRIIAYDPQPAYERIADTANPLKRIQVRTDISMQQLFPKKRDGFCDCGCGVVLSGRQTRWATEACGEFAWYVYAIIAGRRTEIRRCLRAYYGRKCNGCGTTAKRFAEGKGRMRSGIEFDHIIPVHKGGGACWLSNYRPLCVDCHRQKTLDDRHKKRLAVQGD